MPSTAADITARPFDLGKLLAGIDDGSIVLPDFQRDFVWNEGETAALVATAMMGWPAGSLLLMRGTPQFFDTRELEGAPPKREPTSYVVLDGQQRLTALFHALRDAGPSRYLLNLERLDEATASAHRVVPSAEDIEEAIEVVKPHVLDQRLRTMKEGGEVIVPFAALYSPSDFFDWRDAIGSQLPPAVKDMVVARLSKTYKDLLGTINHYQFPAVVLESDLPTEAVARIFERINRGGVQLSTFDLVVARAYSLDWNLRTEWDRARLETELLEVYLGEDGLPILQALALKNSGDIRRPAVLALKSRTIQDEWEDAVQGMESAAEFVAASGMRNPDWLPYKALLIPLAAWARAHRLEDHRQILESWLWARSIEMEYDVASSTKVAADYNAIGSALALGTPMRFSVVIDRMFEATRKKQAVLWRTFLSLLLRNGAGDLLTGEKFIEAPSSSTAASVTSLFRRSDMQDSEPASPHLRVLSQVLLRRGATSQFRGRSILSAIAEASQDPAVASRLQAQFLPSEIEELWSLDPSVVLENRFRALRAYVGREFSAIDLIEAPRDDV